MDQDIKRSDETDMPEATEVQMAVPVPAEENESSTALEDNGRLTCEPFATAPTDAELEALKATEAPVGIGYACEGDETQTDGRQGDEDWTVLDEFCHWCRQGELELVKEIASHIRAGTLPQGFEDEQAPGAAYPYTIEMLATQPLCKGGNTALHYASAVGSLPVTKYLGMLRI